MEKILHQYNRWWENIPAQEELIERKGLLKQLIGQLTNNQIVFITGLRRIGKTSLIKQLIYHLIEKQNIEPKYIFYVSLDHYYLQKYSILEIVEKYMQINRIAFGEKIYLFFDEVTHQKDFEIQLKNLFDLHSAKMYISSSSASLLKSKKAYLTGRNIIFEVLPLDFDEYLIFKNIKISAADAHLLPVHFHDFLTTGGIPEYVLRGDISYITELVDDIILKDIAAQNHIRQTQILKEFFLLLMERAGKRLSINKIAAILKISTDTARRYLEMFADSFLIHLMAKQGKTNDTLLSPKKIYAADLGIRSIFIGKRDFGSLFENYVYLKIKHLNPKYVYQNSIEIDFVTENKCLIEAKYHNEALSVKQQKLFDTFEADKKIIIRNHRGFEDIV